MSELKVDKVSPRTGTYVSLNTVGSKNIIINGDMSIAQRGTSASGLTASTYSTVDRWLDGILTAGTWTISQSTDVPTGQGFSTSMKIDCTTANGSLSAGSLFNIQQRFEGQNLQYLKKGTANAESLTLSFWVKSNKTGTYIAELFDNDNSRNISKSYTINSASTWEKKTITFAGDTTGALDNDNNRSFNLDMWLAAGTDYTSGTLATSWESTTSANRAVGQVNLADNTANEWYITGVQLEAGTTASDFEFLPYDMNLQRCLRYYEKFYPITTAPADGAGNLTIGGSGGYPSWTSYVANNQRASFVYLVPKRASPTVTFYRGLSTATAGKVAVFDGSSWVVQTIATSNYTAHGFWIGGTSATTAAAGNYLFEGGWSADCEL